MDRNQATGLVLIFLLLFVYFTFLAPKPTPTPIKSATSQAASPDSLAKNGAAAQGSLASKTADTLRQAILLPGQDSANPAKPEIITLENADIKVCFSTQGARPIRAELKKYKKYNGQPLVLFDAQSSSFALKINQAGVPVHSSQIIFTPTLSSTKDSIGFKCVFADGTYIIQTYTLPKTGFEIGYKISSNIKASTDPNAYFLWQDNLAQLEQDISQNRTTATINYYSAEAGFDNISETSTDPETAAPANLQWIAFKQKFFNAGFISLDIPFGASGLKTVSNLADSSHIKTLTAQLAYPISGLNKGASFKFYFGPNKFDIVKNVAPEYQRNVYLGWPVIRLVNQYVVVPVFHFLEDYIANYGIIIILLVLLIKLALFPLSFKSYLSMAKMKVLKPEIDQIKEKHGTDMAAIQQEQMKLYSQVGINPLSGCIPLVLQMPVLLAMFNFFPSSIELRQESFLWAHDLSTYDSIFTLPFSLPSYGSHVSLFTILMTLSTLVLTWINNQTSTVAGPMQSLSYIMPVIFMVILNSLPAGLSFYYLVSNVVSIGQQLIIRQMVDEDKIRLKLDENKIKNATKKKSGFAQRLEDALKNAQEMKKAKK